MLWQWVGWRLCGKVLLLFLYFCLAFRLKNMSCRLGLKFYTLWLLWQQHSPWFFICHFCSSWGTRYWCLHHLWLWSQACQDSNILLACTSELFSGVMCPCHCTGAEAAVGKGDLTWNVRIWQQVIPGSWLILFTVLMETFILWRKRVMVSDWAWYSETLCARFLSLESKKKKKNFFFICDF